MKGNIEYHIKLLKNNEIKLEILNNEISNIDKYVLLKIIRDLFNFSNKKECNKNINEIIKIFDILLENISIYVVNELNNRKNSDIEVDTLYDLYNLKYDFFYNGKKMNRFEGLKVYVKSQNAVYQLISGIDNKNWVLIKE